MRERRRVHSHACRGWRRRGSAVLQLMSSMQICEWLVTWDANFIPNQCLHVQADDAPPASRPASISSRGCEGGPVKGVNVKGRVFKGRVVKGWVEKGRVGKEREGQGRVDKERGGQGRVEKGRVCKGRVVKGRVGKGRKGKGRVGKGRMGKGGRVAA